MTGTGDAKASFLLLFLVLMVVAAGNNALSSVMPAIGREIGMADLMIAMVFSVSAALWTLTAPYWGRKSDQHGRKKLIRLGLIGYVVSTTGAGVVVLAGLSGWLTPVLTFLLFTLLRSLFGLLGSAANPAAQAYVAARTTGEARTNALATLSSAFGLGTVLGPAVAPFMVVPILGLSGPLFGFALLAVITMLAVNRYLPDDAPGSLGWRKDDTPALPLRWRDRRIAPFLGVGFVAGSAQAAMTQCTGFLIIDHLALSPAKAQSFIGVALMAGAGATLVAQWGLIRMLRMTPKALLQWGTGLCLAGAAIMAMAGSYGTIVTGFAIISLGAGFVRPGFTAGASLAVRVEEQGAVAGAVTAINGACFIISPAVGVALYHVAQPLPFALSGLLLAGTLAYALTNDTVRQAGRTPVPETPTPEQ
ncbi:MFS transporter [Parapedomonas caeni]